MENVALGYNSPLIIRKNSGGVNSLSALNILNLCFFKGRLALLLGKPVVIFNYRVNYLVLLSIFPITTIPYNSIFLFDSLYLKLMTVN